MPPNFWLLPASIVNYEPEVFANAGEKPRIPRNCAKSGIRNRSCFTRAALAQSAIEMPSRTV
jgi:hypothetical protein